MKIDSATIAGIVAETALTGNGVKSAVVGWRSFDPAGPVRRQ
jgi:hypothetical protein